MEEVESGDERESKRIRRERRRERKKKKCIEKEDK